MIEKQDPEEKAGLYEGFSLFAFLLILGFSPFWLLFLGVIEYSIDSWPWFAGSFVYLVVVTTIAIAEVNKRKQAKLEADRKRAEDAAAEVILPELFSKDDLKVANVKPKDFGLIDDLLQELEPHPQGSTGPPAGEKPAALRPTEAEAENQRLTRPRTDDVKPKDFGLPADLPAESGPAPQEPTDPSDEETTENSSRR